MTATGRLTLVWLVLLSLTFASVAIEQGGTGKSIAVIAILGIAMLKISLIGNYFMDLRVAPRQLRLMFEGYVISVFVALVSVELLVG